jgi:hypothetical protein
MIVSMEGTQALEETDHEQQINDNNLNVVVEEGA